jgi:hypothetical protein
MTKTFIGEILLGTIFVFGAIVPLVLIGLLRRSGATWRPSILVWTAYGEAP